MDPKDLFDNAQNLDYALNDITKAIWTDRFGRSRKSYWGMEQDFSAQLLSQKQQLDAQIFSQQQRFDLFIQSSGYKVIGEYNAGPLTINDLNQLIRHENEFWKLDASTPVPFTTTGNDSASWVIDSTHFVSVGDAALRQELAEPGGAGIIGGLSKPVTWNGYAGGANPAGTVSSVAAFKSAAAQGSTTYIPKGMYLIDSSIDLSNAEWDFAKGAVLNISAGAVVTIGNVKAGLYNIFTGAGGVVFSKENDVAYPEWFVSGPDATPGLTKCVDACIANRVRMHISYPLALGSPWIINERIPITCNSRVTFSPTAGNTKGIEIREGARSWNGRIQLPNVTAFSDFGIKLRGCNLINLEVGAISACGDGLVFETLNATARQILDNNVRIQSIQGCTAAFAVTGDNSGNVFQGNEIYANFIVGCNVAVEYRSAVSQPNFDSNSWEISAIDGAIDGSIGLKNSTPSRISKTTFKVKNWCGGFGGAGKLIDGDFNGSDILLRLNAEIPYSAINISGSSNKISYSRPGWSAMPIAQCVFNAATALADFNGGVPINHDQQRLRLTVPSSIPVGGRVVGFSCTPLDDGFSLLYSVTPTSPAGMSLEYVRREAKNVVRISWVNQGTAAVAAGALIDFTLNIG